MTTSDDVVSERLDEVREQIERLGRSDVTVIAVTKGFDRSAIDCAQRLGLRDIGENYAQELLGKVDALEPDTRVHFMGRIQRNKVRKLVADVDVWHSIARPEILAEIAKRQDASSDEGSAGLLIQVRPHDDESKDGIAPSQIEDMLDKAEQAGVDVAGLMTIGVLGDPVATRKAFEEVDRLAERYGLAERSMGMSADYRDALDAGSTMLRLGSVLFGQRPTPVRRDSDAKP